MDYEEKPRYKQLSELPQEHEHHFQVTASKKVVIRWCTSCGKSWRVQAEIDPMYDRWTFIDEPFARVERP